MVLAACSSSAPGDETAGSRGSSPNAAAPTTSSVTADSTRSSSATRSPISVGFLNQGQGTVTFPDFAAGAKAAVTYLNAHGGINGHPVKLDTCNTAGTPASSVACANTFVQHQDPVVLEGIDVMSDSALPILAGAHIPLVGHTAFGVKQADSPDAFFFGAATGAYDVVPLVVMAKKLGLKSVSYTAADAPANRGFVKDDLTPAATALGLGFDASYYPAAKPNYSTIFATAAARHPDAVFFTASEPDCTGLVSAAKTLGYQGKVFAGSCSAFVKQAGAAAQGVFTDSDLYLPDDTSSIPAKAAAQIATYRAAMAHGFAKYEDGFAQMTFSATMDLAHIMSGIATEVTSASVLTALGDVHGLTSFMGQTLNCDGKQWPGESSVCASGLIEYQVKDGKRVMFSDGFVHGQNYVG